MLPSKGGGGDEDDGYDETIIPLDFRQSGQIRDDDLFRVLVSPMVAGVTMTCLMDSCHSGTVLDSSIRKDRKPTFLQPPHFRAPASDDIIDQIASRFGRAALDLGGDFYNRGKRNRSDYDAFLDDVFANLYDDDDAFQDCLSEYYRKLMGSQDICCCPLCYIESHQRLMNLVSGEEEDSNEESKTKDSIVKLWHNPTV